MKQRLHRGAFAVALLVCIAPAMQVRAATIGFECITNNLAGDCTIGETQVEVQVSSLSPTAIRFDIVNVGPQDSVVSEIYFDDGSLLNLPVVDDSQPQVDFAMMGSPRNLPGGNLLAPPFIASFLADAVAAPPYNGVGPGESVGIEFILMDGKTIDDVLMELASGELRIGLHVIAFASGGSESFVNASIVPEPSALLLVALALLGLRAARRAPLQT